MSSVTSRRVCRAPCVLCAVCRARYLEVVGGGVKSDVDVIALAKRSKVAKHRLETTNRAHTCEIDKLGSWRKKSERRTYMGLGSG